MNDLFVNYKPTKLHLKQIEEWLIQEENESQKGFYCNWYIIEKSFNNNHMAIITKYNFAIGFIIFKIDHFISHIDIFEIMPSFRKKNIGRYFINEMFRYLKEEKILVVTLYCKPISSELFWSRIGFNKNPKNTFRDNKVWMYKPLIEISNPSQLILNSCEIIELWDNKFDGFSETKPKWKWNLKFRFNSRILEKPIIHPVDYNWEICWKYDNEIIKKNKISYFEPNISFSKFIIITELPKF